MLRNNPSLSVLQRLNRFVHALLFVVLKPQDRITRLPESSHMTHARSREQITQNRRAEQSAGIFRLPDRFQTTDFLLFYFSV